MTRLIGQDFLDSVRNLILEDSPIKVEILSEILTKSCSIVIDDSESIMSKEESLVEVSSQ